MCRMASKAAAWFTAGPFSSRINCSAGEGDGDGDGDGEGDGDGDGDEARGV